ncbi:MAG: hypothetical protein KIS87_04535 [Phycisphaeraceae bacterium]|nr:hypothetical protein [Phycisphaeraceae bacterium]
MFGKWMSVLVVFMLVLPATADPVGERLATARTRHDAAMRESAAELVAAVEARLSEARAAGDEIAASRYAAELAAFGEDQRILPACVPSASRRFELARRRAAEDLVRAVEVAQESYRRSAQSELADGLDDELADAQEAADEASWSDLRSQIRLPASIVEGAWAWDDTSLIKQNGGRAVLRLLASPARSYELELVVSRTGGDTPLQVLFRTPTGGHGLLTLAGWGGQTSGLGLIGGKDGNENGTAHSGGIFSSDEPARVVLSVNLDGVVATVDGVRIVSWSGDWKSMTLHDGLRGPGPQIIAAAGSGYRMDAIRFREIVTDRQLAVQPQGSRETVRTTRPAQADPWTQGRQWVGTTGLDSSWTFSVKERSGDAMTLVALQNNGWRCEIQGTVSGNRFTPMSARQTSGVAGGRRDLKRVTGYATVRDRVMSVSFDIVYDRGNEKNRTMRIIVPKAE